MALSPVTQRFVAAGLVAAGLGMLLAPAAAQFFDERFPMGRGGSIFGPPMKIDAERCGFPAISTESTRLSNSSKKIRISSRARCWPRQVWTP